MRWIIELIVRYRNFCSLMLTTVLSVLMIIAPGDKNTQGTDQYDIARYLTMTVFYPVYITISQVTSYTNVYAKNKELHQQLAEVSTQLQLIRDQSSENMRLRGLLGFAENTLYKLTPVRVVARDPSPQYRSVVVNGGSSQGVTTFMPLVGEHGAVGKVTQVMGNMSMVQLLRDPSNRTSVMVLRSRSAGILQTENGRDFFVRLRNHEDVTAGDTIITSGLGGIYPKGLTVGYVTKIDDKNNPLFKRAYMDFAVNFDRLEEVFVMRLPPQWAAHKSEIDSIKFAK